METVELVEYINRIITATRAGQITWTRANPTTFAWNAQNKGNVVLQKVEQRIPQPPASFRNVTHYIFQANESGRGAVLNVSSSDIPEINQPLHMLFLEASRCVSKEGLDFLNSLLPPGA